MINILKEGNNPDKKRIIYKTVCNSCECEFEFEIEDCSKVEKCLDGRIYITCPCCFKELSIKRSFLEYREEKIK